MLLQRGGPDLAVSPLMVNLHDGNREPTFKLRQGHRRVLVGVVAPPCLRIGEGAAWQVMDLVVQSAKKPFDMAAEVWPRDRSPVQIHAIFLAGLAKHGGA